MQGDCAHCGLGIVHLTDCSHLTSMTTNIEMNKSALECFYQEEKIERFSNCFVINHFVASLLFEDEKCGNIQLIN